MSQSILILYATLTGNAEEIARTVAAAASHRGYEPSTKDMADYRFELHALEGRILLIASTYGEGEPPPGAEEFYDWLKARSAPLSRVYYSVYALGDSSYTDFCGFGKALDAEFERLGAVRIAERSDNDLDYETGLDSWLDTVFQGFQQHAPVLKRSEAA